jgi:hypothetical protein
MKVTILGSGNMARAIATRMLAGGNSVTLLDRDPGKAQALAKELSTQAKQGAKVQAAGLGSPLAGPVVVSALYYPVAREVVGSYGDQLAGKILVDTSNPINETYDDLVTPPGTSAAGRSTCLSRAITRRPKPPSPGSSKQAASVFSMPERCGGRAEIAPPLEFYEQGTWGPPAADRLLAQSGQYWRLGCSHNPQ